MVYNIYDKPNSIFINFHNYNNFTVVIVILSSLVSITLNPSSPDAISNFGRFGLKAKPIDGAELYTIPLIIPFY